MSHLEPKWLRPNMVSTVYSIYIYIYNGIVYSCGVLQPLVRSSLWVCLSIGIVDWRDSPRGSGRLGGLVSRRRKTYTRGGLQGRTVRMWHMDHLKVYAYCLYIYIYILTAISSNTKRTPCLMLMLPLCSALCVWVSSWRIINVAHTDPKICHSARCNL